MNLFGGQQLVKNFLTSKTGPGEYTALVRFFPHGSASTVFFPALFPVQELFSAQPPPSPPQKIMVHYINYAK